MTRKPFAASPSHSATGHIVICAAKPMMSSSAGSAAPPEGLIFDIEPVSLDLGHICTPLDLVAFEAKLGSERSALTRAPVHHTNPTMRREPERLANETFDLLIIGGGVTGACVARDAALRGLKVALVEKNDFAHATSAHNSKLIHGGLALSEEFRAGAGAGIAERAPHLAAHRAASGAAAAFLMPIYNGGFKARAHA